MDNEGIAGVGKTHVSFLECVQTGSGRAGEEGGRESKKGVQKVRITCFTEQSTHSWVDTQMVPGKRPRNGARPNPTNKAGQSPPNEAG
eukprot:365042-Chlamydomonas_euryale.AAC.27